MKTVSRRAVVRVVSFSLAVCVTLGAAAYGGFALATRYKTNLEYTYLRALDDLSDYLGNIETTLEKGIYANTAPMQIGMAAKLLRDTSGAKAALAQLPLGDVALDNINKFLAQAGDYASYLSASIAKGREIPKEEAENLEALRQYAQGLNLDLKELQARMEDGGLSIGETLEVYNNLSSETENQEEPVFNSGFHEMNEGFTDFPTLIYDGPFSDHITRRKSVMLEKEAVVTQSAARDQAARFLALSPAELQPADAAAGNLPVFRFTGGTVDITVTQAGGYVKSMLNSRDMGEAKLDYKAAAERARAYLADHGMESMKESYYVVQGGICTINYAYEQDGVVYYPDLVKVGVALDNGEVVSYDATGYLMNHTERALPQKTISMEQARASVSPRLQITTGAVALIPTAGLHEVLCYEFHCVSPTGEELLVYINTETGLEEQIYILLKSDGGVLVM